MLGTKMARHKAKYSRISHPEGMAVMPDRDKELGTVSEFETWEPLGWTQCQCVNGVGTFQLDEKGHMPAPVSTRGEESRLIWSHSLGGGQYL